MDISVTMFKTHCLELIRKVESNGESVTIKRRGKIVARLEPALPVAHDLKPWEQLQALGGTVHAAPGESVASDGDFHALR